MENSKNKFKTDDFVAEMMSKFPALKAMKEKLSFWQDDPRFNLMGTWRCDALPTVEIHITVAYNYFGVAIFDTSADGDVHSTFHALHKGETDRLYYIIYKGKIVEIIIEGDLEEEGEDNGPNMILDRYSFYLEDGTRSFVQETQAMADDDTIGIEAMRYLRESEEE